MFSGAKNLAIGTQETNLTCASDGQPGLSKAFGCAPIASGSKEAPSLGSTETLMGCCKRGRCGEIP